MNEKNDDTRGFHPGLIILPVLAAVLIALVLAPALYATREYAAQHHQTVKELPSATGANIWPNENPKRGPQ
jgi:hypothetical protein